MACFRCAFLKCQLKEAASDPSVPELLECKHKLELELEWEKAENEKLQKEVAKLRAQVCALQVEVDAKEIVYKRELVECEERVKHAHELFKQERHGKERALKALESIRTLNTTLIAQNSQQKGELSEYAWVFDNIFGQDPKLIQQMQIALLAAKDAVKRKRGKNDMEKVFLDEVKKANKT